MQWIRRDEVMEPLMRLCTDCSRAVLQADQPEMTVETAVPILISASFLKIPDLEDTCIDFLHANMNSVLSSAPGFSAVGDTLITRFPIANALWARRGYFTTFFIFSRFYPRQ